MFIYNAMSDKAKVERMSTYMSDVQCIYNSHFKTWFTKQILSQVFCSDFYSGFNFFYFNLFALRFSQLLMADANAIKSAIYQG